MGTETKALIMRGVISTLNKVYIDCGLSRGITGDLGGSRSI